MKRNRPPDDPQEYRNEQDLTRDRINELFSHCSPEQRRIPLTNRGTWIPDLKHVRLEQGTKISATNMIHYSSQYKYHYLDPYEALFCLETNQLIIYFNQIPISLAEAYRIILENKGMFAEYRVFQKLTSSGYQCNRPQKHVSSNDPSGSSTLSNRSETSQTNIDLESIEKLNTIEESYSIDKLKVPFEEVLEGLQKLGPQEMESTTGTDDSVGMIDMYNYKLSFDVYKREFLAKHKPREGYPGNPDYHIIVCDINNTKPPDADMLINLKRNHGNMESDKLVFALVDDDSSIIFTQFLKVSSLHPEKMTDIESHY